MNSPERLIVVILLSVVVVALCMHIIVTHERLSDLDQRLEKMERK